MKRIRQLVGLILGLTLVVAAGWYVLKGWPGLGPRFPGTLFERRTSGEVLELQGNVEIREIRVSFAVPGRILRMYVQEGDRVRAGQLLAELDRVYYRTARDRASSLLAARRAELLRLERGSRPEEIAEARAHREAARAAFVHAEREFQRAKSLLEHEVIAQEEYERAQALRDQAEARLKAAEATLQRVVTGPRSEDIERARALVREAEARLEEARQRLRDTYLYAPGSGVIQTRFHEPGEQVHAGEPIYSISVTDPARVRAYIAEPDLERIRPGMRAEVVTDTGWTVLGQVGFISPVAEFTPKTVQTRELRTRLVYRIRIIVHNAAGYLRPGMPVTVRIPAGS